MKKQRSHVYQWWHVHVGVTFFVHFLTRKRNLEHLLSMMSASQSLCFSTLVSCVFASRRCFKHLSRLHTTTPTKHQQHTTHPTHRTSRESEHVRTRKDGELCLIRTHFRGDSQRYLRANRSLHSAEFQQFSSGTAND